MDHLLKEDGGMMALALELAAANIAVERYLSPMLDLLGNAKLSPQKKKVDY